MKAWNHAISSQAGVTQKSVSALLLPPHWLRWLLAAAQVMQSKGLSEFQTFGAAFACC